VSVTQTHQGLGGFSLALRSGGAADDFVARLNPWDHILITPKGIGPQPDLASVKATSLFSGRIDQLDMDGGSVTIGGPSIAVWMGDEAGRGRYADAATAASTTGVSNWLLVIFTRAGSNVNGLTTSTEYWQNLQSGNIAWEIERFVTVRQALDDLAALCDRPFEWLVKPNGEIWIEGWAGSPDYTRTVFSFFPEVMLADGLERTDGVSTFTSPQSADVPLQVFPSDISVTWDFSTHAARGIARGNGSPAELRSTGTNKNTYDTNGFGFDPSVRIGWDTIVDFDTNEPGVIQAAANSVGRLASIRREWTVQAGSSEIVGYVKPGDYVWLHADQLPGIGAMTYANEAEDWAGINAVTDPAVARVSQAANVSVGGRTLHPVRGRVESMSWPVSDRFDVWFASTWDGSGEVRLINDLVDFDPEGPASIDVNGTKPRWQMQRKYLGTTISRSFSLQANDKAAR
jgi:hypothetical protein